MTDSDEKWLSDISESIMKEIEESGKKSVPVKFPNVYYNVDGEQIEVRHKDEDYYGDWIDHNLTLFRNQETDKIIGYEIVDLFGLLRKCLGKELSGKIKKLIKSERKRLEELP